MELNPKPRFDAIYLEGVKHMNPKETTAYKSEFLVINCPYCGATHYIDVEDDMGEGILPENGRKMTCQDCKKVMRVLPSGFV